VISSASVFEIANAVRFGETKAADLAIAVIEDISKRNGQYVCFTRVLADSAIAASLAVDQQVRDGIDPGPLAGVPFAVKDLYDIAGLPTTAGAKMRIHAAPAKEDAAVVARLKAAGAVLIGTLNMDEYAYGFATVNPHFGTTRNPHDIHCLAGGSSGGSAAAVAAGFVPFTLGSDTNGSIRVPAALCGLWGFRPADGAVAMGGTFPFVKLLDTVGPFARSATELESIYHILADLPETGTVVAIGNTNATDLPRIARLEGWFAKDASSEVLDAMNKVMSHLGVSQVAQMPEAETARSASYLLTAAQGGALHLETMRTRAMEYDPAVRDRLLAGAMLPAAIYQKAMAFRSYYRARVKKLFDDYDILIAPCTPVVAPRIDQATILIDGKQASARANLGIYTQPLSLAGIPVASAPFAVSSGLPIGLQFATAPGREATLFRLLRALEADGLFRCSLPMQPSAEGL
jgi:AtzE family amidohydrolase